MDKFALKPCPFCGGTAETIDVCVFGEDNRFWVKCLECYAETSAYGSAEEAEAAWNRRAAPEARRIKMPPQGRR